MKLVIATTNPHKAREFERFLEPLGISVARLDEVEGTVPEPVENASTFEGNARLKALAYAEALRIPCLADDSGLEVAALGGAPGVRSARYAGNGGSRDERDRRNREKLLVEVAALGDVDRSARLVCALCLVDASGRILFETRGELAGVLVDDPRGGRGFGYDTHLLIPELGKTAAELDDEELSVRSHRGKATRALTEFLAAWLEGHSGPESRS